jgi:hypothetical protein
MREFSFLFYQCGFLLFTADDFVSCIAVVDDYSLSNQYSSLMGTVVGPNSLILALSYKLLLNLVTNAGMLGC